MFKLFVRGSLLVLLGFTFLCSCRDNKNDPPPTPKSSDASITAISVSLGGETFNVPVPAPGETSTLKIFTRIISSARKATTVNITKGNEGATIKVGTKNFTNGDLVDFTKDVTFSVIAADGTLKTYTVSILGCGSKDNPCQVSTAKQLSEIREGLDDSYVLMNNITLPDANADGAVATGISDYATKGWLPIGHDATLKKCTFTGDFKGTLDGAGFTIENFYINRRGEYVGLFGVTTGEIKNLGIKGITGSPCITAENKDGECNVGILVGYSKGRIDNCYTSGDVLCSGSKSSSVGGLVGMGFDIKINNCSASGNIAVSDEFTAVGGLVGFLTGEVKNSYATGNIAASSHFKEGENRNLRVGGLAGCGVNTTFENSYATGNVSALGTSYVGGLVGLSHRGGDDCSSVNSGNCLIFNCFSTGNVEANGDRDCAAGGLLGFCAGVPVKNIYATGNVSMIGASKDVGVLFGRGSGGGGVLSEKAFYNSEAAITKDGNAITTPSDSDSDYKTIIPKTKLEMQSDTFTGLLNGTNSVWGRDDTKNNKLPYIKGVGVGK